MTCVIDSGIMAETRVVSGLGTTNNTTLTHPYQHTTHPPYQSLTSMSLTYCLCSRRHCTTVAAVIVFTDVVITTVVVIARLYHCGQASGETSPRRMHGQNLPQS